MEVLSWGPDRGNPTSIRQGRGPELTGRLAAAVGWRWWASVRAGLEEAVGAGWSRTRVKRRKASFGGVSWLVAAKPDSCWCRGRIGDGITAKSQRLTQRDLLGSEACLGRPEESEGSMAQQKSEDRVVRAGLAVLLAGGSPVGPAPSGVRSQ